MRAEGYLCVEKGGAASAPPRGGLVTRLDSYPYSAAGVSPPSVMFMRVCVPHGSMFLNTDDVRTGYSATETETIRRGTCVCRGLE